MFDAVGLIGRVAVMAGFAATCIASILYFRSLSRPGLTGFARTGFHVTTSAVFISAAALLILILKHQFQYHYVWAYSSRELPTGLLMSTFYAGQEGSFMLWTVMVSITGIFLLSYTQKHGIERETMGFYTAILGFLTLLLVVKNPFALIEGGQVPPDGKGLNPLLQNFWMQIHPPILFLGFASMTPPFALAMSALMRRSYQQWVVSSLPWVVGGAMVLGLGIALGGFWAYETLGWGGWWGWDPVENSSLIPWLVSVSLVHTMLTQKRTKGLIMTNFVLAILSFVTVLYSTFLTRSGVLGDASVHSFVDPGRFAFTLLVLFMFVFSDTGFAFLFLRFTKIGGRIMERFTGGRLLAMAYLVTIVPSIPIFAKIAGDLVPVFTDMIHGGPAPLAVLLYPMLGLAHVLNVLAWLWLPALLFKLVFLVYTLTGRLHSAKEYTSFAMLSRETFLGLGSAVIGVLTVIVLLGTSLPIVPKPVIASINSVLSGIGASPLGNTVDPSFYDGMGLPLGVLMAGLAAFALLLKWKQNTMRDMLRAVPVSLGISAAFTAVLFFAAGVHHPAMLALAFAAAFSFVVNVQVAWRILRGNPRFTGAYLAHIGISLVLLGIIGSGFYGRKQGLELPMGVPKQAFGHTFVFTGVEPFWNGERYYFKVALYNPPDERPVDTVKTVMFVSMYGGQEQIMRNPGISRFLTKDIYIEPQAYTTPDPEGGTVVQMTKGKTADFGGYTVRFDDFDMNNRMGADAFTIGAVFTVDRPGRPSQQFTVKRTTGPDGVTSVPALVTDGDLEISVQGMTPNRENLAMSTIDVRLRNPKVVPDPNTLRETLVVEASLKPFISLVWIGIILMVIGFAVARIRRGRDAQQLTAPARPGIPRPAGMPAAGVRSEEPVEQNTGV